MAEGGLYRDKYSIFISGGVSLIRLLKKKARISELGRRIKVKKEENN